MKRPLCIGVNAFLLVARSGGLRQYFCRLFRELLIDSELRFTFFCAEQNVPFIREIGDTVERAKIVVLGEQIDVNDYWGEMDIYFCPFGPLFPRPVPLPSVIMLADIQEKYHPEFFSKDQLWDRAFHFDHSLREADRVITISAFSRKTFVDTHGLRAAKVTVAHLAPSDAFRPVDADPDRMPDLPERFVFFPANRWKHKNHALLFRALHVLRSDLGIDVPCVLTGYDVRPDSREPDLVDELGIGDLVHVLGYLAEPQLAAIYRKATMLVFPSLFEGFGMPVVEAMASGCPVIASDATSLPEIGEDAALYFDPHSPDDCARQIARFWTDEELRRRYRERGLVKAESYSFRNTARIHREVFFELDAKPPVRKAWGWRVLRERARDLRILARKPLAIPSILRHSITRKILRLCGRDGVKSVSRDRGGSA